MTLTKKILMGAASLAIIFVVGGIGGLFFRDRVVPSLLASFPGLSRMRMFQNVTGNTTVIERKEQLIVREDDSVEAIVLQPSTAVVDIVAFPKTDPAGSVLRQAKVRAGVLMTNDGVVATFGDPFQPASASFDTPSEDVSYRVLLHDGSAHDATLIGSDRLTGLVFFRISGNDFPAISIANSDDSTPGKKLVAIGKSKDAERNRFSIGIVSDRNATMNLSGKTVASSEKWEGVFEADFTAPDSYVGGPAVNFRGEMVGLFGRIDLDGKPSFFLLPSNVVRETFRLAMDGKLPDRATLGAYYVSLTKASVATSGTETRDRGALIYSPSGKTGLSVLAGSPAAIAGLRHGDIVESVNGTEICPDQPLSVVLGRLFKGDEAEFTVLRAGRELTVPVQF